VFVIWMGIVGDEYIMMCWGGCRCIGVSMVVCSGVWWVCGVYGVCWLCVGVCGLMGL
jgi:hypothetical protein